VVIVERAQSDVLHTLPSQSDMLANEANQVGCGEDAIAVVAPVRPLAGVVAART
jgi:hypothetical protein